MTTVELIKSIAFDFGWTVSTDEEEDTVVFDFRYYTKHGLDYGFCAELTGNNFDGFLGEVERNCEDFDPDYEAYRWIGYDGHGIGVQCRIGIMTLGQINVISLLIMPLVKKLTVFVV